eukprot:3774609-Pyramimonas_sp.AAC.1
MSFWSQVPYVFLAALASGSEGCPITACKQKVRDGLREIDDAVAGGLIHVVHRVAVALALGPDNDIRRELDEFVNHPTSCLGATARAALEAHARGSLVSRKVEGVHSLINRWKKKKTWMLPNLVNCKVKQPELKLQLKQDRAFFVFAADRVGGRHLQKLLLSFMFPPQDHWKISLMTQQEPAGRRLRRR